MAKQFLEQKILNGKIAYLGTENSAHYILQNRGLNTFLYAMLI